MKMRVKCIIKLFIMLRWAQIGLVKKIEYFVIFVLSLKMFGEHSQGYIVVRANLLLLTSPLN